MGGSGEMRVFVFQVLVVMVGGEEVFGRQRSEDAFDRRVGLKLLIVEPVGHKGGRPRTILKRAPHGNVCAWN